MCNQTNGMSQRQSISKWIVSIHLQFHSETKTITLFCIVRTGEKRNQTTQARERRETKLQGWLVCQCGTAPCFLGLVQVPEQEPRGPHVLLPLTSHARSRLLLQTAFFVSGKGGAVPSLGTQVMDIRCCLTPQVLCEPTPPGQTLAASLNRWPPGQGYPHSFSAYQSGPVCPLMRHYEDLRNTAIRSVTGCRQVAPNIKYLESEGKVFSN